jgi:predicted NBD/HSP70 family sugar kinase
LAVEHIAVGAVEKHQLVGSPLVFPKNPDDYQGLQELPAENIAQTICRLVQQAAGGETIQAVGVGFPGIIRGGVIHESPNLQQVKGVNFQTSLTAALEELRISAPVLIFNDADVMAAGIAATEGHLDQLIRCWTLGDGVGYGRYPWTEGVWEGGHIVVTLDPKERFCGCGGEGHLEGIMGHRSMRLRFLDMEPEEVFEGAKAGEARCLAFVKLWHRALAAATATSIHLEGSGRFFISGPKAKYIQLGLLNLQLQEMVKMSPLQGSVFEVIPTSDQIGVIGAAVNAEQATLKA